MRFKKLKISVAVALIIFALIVANTIAFGLLQNKDTSNLVTTINPVKNSSIETNTSSQTSNPVQQTQTSDTTQVVVNHLMMRTRAS